MSVLVPTATEYSALYARVTALEAAGNQTQAAAIAALAFRVAALESTAISTGTVAAGVNSRLSALETTEISTSIATAALTDRVTALEGAPPPTTGVQAARIADLVQILGFNTFSSMSSTANVWGSYPADYSPASVNAALNWLLNGSTYRLQGREYHYAGRESIQLPWLTALNKRLKFSMAIGANGDVSAVASMLTLANNPALGISFVEGINEPNNDFGSGTRTIAQTLAAQQALTGTRMGPSIIFGLPHPEGWIVPYMGASQSALNAAMDIANGHFYPPSHCDADDGAGPAFADVVRGMGIAYPGKSVAITEFHPTLYNHASPTPIAPGGSIDGYWLIAAWLRAYQLGVRSFHWYSLFDYGTTYLSGLFPQTGGVAPRSSAYAVRNVCTVCADNGATRDTFTPGRLDYTLSGMPTGAWDSLFQGSDGKFYLMLTNPKTTQGGTPTSVVATFGATPTSVTEFDLSDGTTSGLTPLQTVTGSATVTSSLTGSVRCLRVVP